MDSKNTIAFVICCKESKYIYDCVENIKKIYGDSVDIIIVDSCSIDKRYFEIIHKYNNIHIEDICNTHYEHGAITHAIAKYQSYEKYVFIQDSMMLKSSLRELEQLQDDEVYVFGDPPAINTGWAWDPHAKEFFYKLNPSFPPTEEYFTLTQWNCFLSTKNTMQKVTSSDIFVNTKSGPHKLSSCAWERVWSIMFTKNEISIKIVDFNSFSKILGGRQ